jgi:hypothetical protein
MRKLFLVLVMVMSTLQGNLLAKATGIIGILNQVKQLKKAGFTKIWWVTDLDGMLVKMPSFDFIEGETTKETFDQVSELVSRIVGLTATEKEWAVKTAKDLVRKDIEFHEQEDLHDTVVALDGSSLNILYNGVVYAGAPKGLALVDYIRFMNLLNQPAPDAVVFSDDKEKNVESVLGTMGQQFPDIKTVGFHYTPKAQENFAAGG